MAFPTVTETGGNDTTNGTSHTITLPAAADGDLLIVGYGLDGVGTQSWAHDQGFTDMVDIQQGVAPGFGFVVKKIKVGATLDTSLVVTSSASEGGGWSVLRVPVGEWSGDLADVEFASANDRTTNPDPPNLDPAGYGAEDILWIAFAGHDGNYSLSAGPTNYTALTERRWADSAGAGVRAAWRNLNATSENPGTFTGANIDDWVAVTIAVRPAAASTIATPGTASLALSTFAPTITASDFQLVTPSTASLATSTFAPSVAVSDNQLVTPGVLALSLSVFAPTVAVSDSQSVTPGLATLALATFAPTVSATANQVVTPGVAALSLVTFAPSVTASANQVVTPGVASLTLSAFAPAVAVSDNQLVSPDVAALSLAAFAPVVTATANQTVTPDTVALVLATFAPSVALGGNQTVTPDTASLVLATFAPSVSTSAAQTVTPDTASLLLATFAPTVTATANLTITPGVATLLLAGFAPTITASDHQVATPATAILTLSLFAPTVVASDHQLVTPGTAALLLATFAPSLVVSSTSTGGQAPDLVAILNLPYASASPVAMVAEAQDHRPGGTALTSAPGATAKHIDP